MKKIVSVLLVAVLLCTAFAACAKKGDSVAAKVTITIEADDTTILENAEVEIKGEDGANPLAIDAIIMALTDYEIEYKTVEFAGSDKIEQIDEYDTEDNKYIWELYLNGDDEPADGRLATVEIEDGDKLLLKRNAYESIISTEETEEPETKAPISDAEY